MSAAKEQVHKMELRKSYRNVWHTDLMSTMAADTPCNLILNFILLLLCVILVRRAFISFRLNLLMLIFDLFSSIIGPCASYNLRKRALYDDMSRYTCCGGYMPCSGKCGERKCPVFCLCTEVFCCFGNSVASTRFLLQDEFNIQTTKCDNCIIGCMVCLQQIACIFSIIACIVGSDELNELSQLLNCLADLVFCSVCSCMQTQHKVEMDKRDGKLGIRPMDVPPVQEMSRIDQSYPPPHVQYGPPHYGQGYPPVGYPPQHQGYPPMYHQQQGYPPSAYPPSQGYPPVVYPPQHQGYPPASSYHSQPPQSHGQGNPPPDHHK
ncbi:hypothetical protein SSX86_029756 [Deinandra increscens subsp. villosa]|uniref:PLAC8 family protein n=1 Tax=Deinandra increscens subsp. villosa TaxID=3103831 RepID=A0AAP0CAR3_9ASTR